MQSSRLSKRRKSFPAEAERSKRVAERRHKWKAVDRARNLEVQKLTDIEDEIGEVPAEGLHGMAIKLAIFALCHPMTRNSRLQSSQLMKLCLEAAAGIDPVAELPEALSMTGLVYRLRIWLTHRLLGLAVAVAPAEVRNEQDRLRSHRRV